MLLADITGYDFFTFIVLPLLIFVARVLDVSIGTLRMVSIGKGRKIFAPLLGFFEIMIWLFAIRSTMRDQLSIPHVVAFALGFAAGNYVGILIENKLAMGLLAVRIFAPKDPGELIGNLRTGGFGTTVIDAHGSSGPVYVIHTIIERRDLHKVIASIENYDPKTFFSVEEVRSADRGIFPEEPGRQRPRYEQSFSAKRKGK